MIYTSYFANYRNFTNQYLVSIARVSPTGFKGLSIVNDNTFSSIAPSIGLLSKYKKSLITDKEYIKEYISQLDKIDLYKFYQVFENCILLCYEKPPKFCHRHVLRWYFKQKNLEMIELSYN